MAFFTLCLLCIHLAQGEDQRNPIIIQKNVTLLSDHLSQFSDDKDYVKGVIEFEGIECNSRYVLVLNVVNGSNEALKFDKVETSCDCQVFSFGKRELLPGEGCEAVVEFKTPSSHPSETYFIGARLKSSGNEVGVLSCRCRLAGNVSFSQEQVFLEVGHSQKAKLDVLCTTPASMGSAKISIDENLSPLLKVSKVISKKSPKESLQFELRDKAISLMSSSSHVGNVEIFFPEIQRKKEVSVVIQKRPPVSLHPSFLFFAEEPETELMIGTAILRISDPKLTPGDGKSGVAKKKNIKVRGEIGDVQLKLEATPLTDSIYRLKFRVRRDELSDVESKKINWSVGRGARSFEFETSWVTV